MGLGSVWKIIILVQLMGTESVKLSIKSETGDLCIQAKDGTVDVSECYWKSGKAQEPQIFDIHPADIDTDDDSSPIPFLIRLKPSKAQTSCLSSISETFIVEKCHLKKSRFRLNPSFPPNQAKLFCSQHEMEAFYNSQPDIHYKIHSSDQLCLELVKSNVAFTKCTQPNASQVWHFCQSANCSLTLSEIKWNSFIKTGMAGQLKDCTTTSTSTMINILIQSSTLPTTSTGKSHINIHPGLIASNSSTASFYSSPLFVLFFSVIIQ